MTSRRCLIISSISPSSSLKAKYLMCSPIICNRTIFPSLKIRLAPTLTTNQQYRLKSTRTNPTNWLPCHWKTVRSGPIGGDSWWITVRRLSMSLFYSKNRVNLGQPIRWARKTSRSFELKSNIFQSILWYLFLLCLLYNRYHIYIGVYIKYKNLQNLSWTQLKAHVPIEKQSHTLIFIAVWALVKYKWWITIFMYFGFPNTLYMVFYHALIFCSHLEFLRIFWLGKLLFAFRFSFEFS